MSARMRAAAKEKRRGGIQPAPVPEPEIVALTEGKEEKRTRPSKAVNEEELIEQDFKALEAGTIGGQGVEGTLAGAQMGFAIDLLEQQAGVDKFNLREVLNAENAKISTSDWVKITDAGQSYEAPFPGDPVWFPENPARMRVRFDQEDTSLRVSEMIAAQSGLGSGMAFEVEAGQWKDYYPDIAMERKDAHIIVHSISLASSNTKNLPFSCELKFSTNTEEGGAMRTWHSPAAEGHTVGSFGVIRGAVVEPDQDFRTSDAPCLYKAKNMTGPWMSRFMTFHFDKFREIMATQNVHTKAPSYYLIKGPPVAGFSKKELTIAQWIFLSFCRSLQFITRRKMDADIKSGASTEAILGASVIQEVQADKSLQFLVSRTAFDRVVDGIQSRVKPATNMAKLDMMKLDLSFVGGSATAYRMKIRQVSQEGLRDELERDPLVGPLSFTVDIRYIAIPSDYGPVQPQNEANVGEKFHAYKKGQHAAYKKKKPATAGGYGAYSYGAAARA